MIRRQLVLVRFIYLFRSSKSVFVRPDKTKAPSLSLSKHFQRTFLRLDDGIPISKHGLLPLLEATTLNHHRDHSKDCHPHDDSRHHDDTDNCRINKVYEHATASAGICEMTDMCCTGRSGSGVTNPYPSVVAQLLGRLESGAAQMRTAPTRLPGHHRNASGRNILRIPTG